jgi:hypothetical protein
MTLDEMNNKAKVDRSRALNSYNSANIAKYNTLTEDSFNNYYLSGDTKPSLTLYFDDKNIGVNDLICFYLQEKKFIAGDSYNYPTLFSSDSRDLWRIKWNTILNNATNATGDGIYGLFPPDENGSAAQTMNASWYLTNNNAKQKKYGDTRYGDTLSGYIGRLNQVKKELGDSARAAKTVYTSPSTYADSSLARKAARFYLYGDSSVSVRPPLTNRDRTGLGILGRRTCSDSIYCYNTIVGGPYNFKVGFNTIATNPTFYGDTTDRNGCLGGERTRFVNALYNLCAYGDTGGVVGFGDTCFGAGFAGHLSDLKDAITRIKNPLDFIDRDYNVFAGDSNTLFTQSPYMVNDVGDSRQTILDYMNFLGGAVGFKTHDFASAFADSTFWGFYNYFKVTEGDDANFKYALDGLNSKLKYALDKAFTIHREIFSLGDTRAISSFGRQAYAGMRVVEPVKVGATTNPRMKWLSQNLIEHSRCDDPNNAPHLRFSAPAATEDGTFVYTTERLMQDGGIPCYKLTATVGGGYGGSASANVFLTPNIDGNFCEFAIGDSVVLSAEVLGSPTWAASLILEDFSAGYDISRNILINEWEKITVVHTIDAAATGFKAYITANVDKVNDSIYIRNIQMQKINGYAQMAPYEAAENKFLPHLGVWSATTNYIDHGAGDTTTPLPHVRGFVAAGVTNATFANDVTRLALDGFSCDRLTLTSTGSWAGYDFTDDTGLDGTVAGETWTFSYDIFVPSIGGPLLAECPLQISEFYGAAWHNYQVLPTLYDTWHRISYTLALNAGTSKIVLRSQIDATVSDGEYYFIRNIQFEKLAFATPYCQSWLPRLAGNLSYDIVATNAMTIEGWIRAYFNYDTAGNPYIFYWKVSTYNMRGVYEAASDRIKFQVYNDAWTKYVGAYTAALTSATLNTWNHFKIMINFTANKVTGYFNGIALTQEGPVDTIAAFSLPTTLYIGLAYTITGQFNGLIADFAISNGGDSSLTHFSDSTYWVPNTLNNILYNRYQKAEFYMGEPSFTYLTKLRKWRKFWVNTRVGKPVASLITYNGLSYALGSLAKQKTVTETTLKQLFGNNKAAYIQYIPTPSIFSTYTVPIRDDNTGEILVRKISFIFDGQNHATDYFLYKKQAPNPSAINVTNTAWGDTQHFVTLSIPTDLDSKTSYLKNYYTDQSVSTGDSVEIITFRDPYYVTSFGRTPAVKISLFIEPSYISIFPNSKVKMFSPYQYVPVTSFWTAGLNNLQAAGYLDSINPIWGDSYWHKTDGTYGMRSYDSRFGYYFLKIGDSQYVKQASIIQYINLYTYGDTINNGYSFLAKRGGINTSFAYASILDVTNGDSLGNVVINWINKTVTFVEYPAPYNNFNNAYWYGDSVVLITGRFQTPVGSDTVSVQLFGDLAGQPNYFARPQVDGILGGLYDHSYPTLTMNDTYDDINFSRDLTSVLKYDGFGAIGKGTIEFWFKSAIPWFAEEALKFNIFCLKAGNNNYNRVELYYDSSIQKLVAMLRKGDSLVTNGYVYVNSSMLGTFNKWNHYKVTWDSDAMDINLYINSIKNLNKFTGGTTTSGIDFQSLSICCIPVLPDDPPLTKYGCEGWMSDFAIYKYVNTDFRLYNANKYHEIKVIPNLAYTYRVKTLDNNNKIVTDIWTSDTTGSLQSNIYSLVGDSFYRVLADSIVSFGRTPLVFKGQVAVVKNTISHNGFYQITNVGDSFAKISPVIPASDSRGLMYPCLSTTFVV